MLMRALSAIAELLVYLIRAITVRPQRLVTSFINASQIQYQHAMPCAIMSV